MRDTNLKKKKRIPLPEFLSHLTCIQRFILFFTILTAERNVAAKYEQFIFKTV